MNGDPSGKALRIITRHKLTREGSLSDEVREIELMSTPILRPGGSVFVMGSCFAAEIRGYLESEGFRVYPDYPRPDGVAIQSMMYHFDIPHLNHYHTHGMLQEFRRQIDGDLKEEMNRRVWKLPAGGVFGEGFPFQDPFRRSTYGRTEAELKDYRESVDCAIWQGIMNAELFIITLGLTEVWRLRRSSLWACAGPGWEWGGGRGSLEFVPTGFGEHFDNVSEMIVLLRQLRGDVPVVITVSPVPLRRTSRELSAVVANCASKSILRAVADEAVRRWGGVRYFPSFELVMSHVNPFEEDGRHIKRDVVKDVVRAFVSTHVGGG